MPRDFLSKLLSVPVVRRGGRRMMQRYITPSKITAWLECAAYLDLKHQVEAGLQAAPPQGMGSFAQLLADKGLAHEAAVLEAYRARGLRVVEVPGREDSESFSAWTKRVGSLLHAADWDVLYQLPMIHDGIRGVADFLLRQVSEDRVVTVEPVDAKLARREAKPGHVLQLSFYAEAIAAATGTRPERMHLWLGSGEVETLLVADFDAYWQRLRGGLARVLELDVAAGSAVPEPCAHCAFCEFAVVCDERRRREDSLFFVAGLRSVDRAVLQDGGVGTLAALAACTEDVPGLPEQRRTRLRVQSELQRQAREQEEALPPPFLLVPPGEDPVYGHGLSQLPEPDDGDVFLDFEGHPFWRADRGLFFLFGLIQRSASGSWEYLCWWAHDEAEEGERTAELVEHLAERRRQHSGMHVYHYNHTERSSLEALVEEHGVAEAVLADLVETGAFVDLLPVVRNAVQIGAESYGLKAVERLTGYQRGHEVDAGAGAVLQYDRWMQDGGQDALDAIAAYNEDDVRATRVVRDWLLEQRPGDLPWRPAVLEPAGDLPELDARVEQLRAYGPATPEHLLGDVLGYWRREWKAYLAPRLVACEGDLEDLLAEPSVLAGLELVEQVERLGKSGKPIRPLMRFRFPPQECTAEDKVLFPMVDGAPGFADIERLDVAAGELDLVWSKALQDRGALPTVVAHNGWFRPQPKPAALSGLADAVLDPALEANPVALALLRRELPRFLPGRGPVGGVFTDDLDAMLDWTTALDGTCVAVQGPPGTGKTYRGARQIRALLQAGKRVGITAFSHHAIDNLLEAVVKLYRDLGELAELQAVKKGGPATWTPGEVAHVPGNKAAADPKYTLVAGTTWTFAGNDLAAQPVDVLVVDEAGQLSLADTLAACRSARSLMLLGDPRQLPQVAQASHPGGSGRSALEHLLGEAVTMPQDRGVFLTQTRRMHPDVCGFVSERIYEGRLSSHRSCAQQDTAFGTGLRWLRAEHVGRSTHALEEVDLVHAEIVRLLGTPWVDQHGVTASLGVADVLVVAPYNDQKDLLRERLDADPRTRGVSVGSVDRFQGREAAVVLFSMATSSAADMARSADFLFSRQRLNVAISRARCLAYLICTEQLLDSRGRDVEEMRLISTLCAFVVEAKRQGQAHDLRALVPAQPGQVEHAENSPAGPRRPGA